MACRIPARKSCSSHLFGVVPSRAAQTAFAPDLTKAITFFVLGPILVKFHIRTRLIKSFPTIYRFWRCSQENSHFTPVHTLRQWKRDKAPNRELSNFLWVMKLYWNRNVNPSRSPCLKTINRNSFERRNFLILLPVLLKIAYCNSANRELSKEAWLGELR